MMVKAYLTYASHPVGIEQADSHFIKGFNAAVSQHFEAQTKAFADFDAKQAAM